jgi:hypothetical protein
MGIFSRISPSCATKKAGISEPGTTSRRVVATDTLDTWNRTTAFTGCAHRVFTSIEGICCSVVDDGPAAADPAKRYKLSYHLMASKSTNAFPANYAEKRDIVS